MIYVRRFPAETVEQLAQRVAAILAHDAMDGAPPYPKGEDGQRWQLDRANNWTMLGDDLVPAGWVRIAHRYHDYECLGAVMRVLRVLDGREVSETEPPSPKEAA